jgi:hypothetical protein
MLLLLTESAFQIQVYELGFVYCPKAHIFRGLKDYSLKEVQQMLSLPDKPSANAPAKNKYILFYLPIDSLLV